MSQIKTKFITDLAVTTAKLAANAVTTAKITDANVTTAKIADANITTAKFATGAVDTAALATNAVTTVKITDGNITTAKYAALSINGAAIATRAVDYTKLDYIANNTFLANVTGANNHPRQTTATEVTAILNPFTTSLKGLAPASGGGTTNFLRADGTWAAPSVAPATSIVTLTTATTLSVPTSPTVYLGVLASGAYTTTLFTAVGNSGLIITLKKASINFDTWTIATTGGQTIGEYGAATSTTRLDSVGEEVQLCSDGTNWLVISRTIPGPITSYTPTITGFGTATSVNFTYARQGSYLKIQAAFVTGTPASGNTQYTLPTGLTTPSTIPSVLLIGRHLRGSTQAQNAHNLICNPSSNDLLVTLCESVSGSNTLLQDTFASFGNSEYQAVDCLVPINGWKG